MIIPVIGPSKAGKTETTKELVRSGILSLSGPVERVDLDEELGSSHRADGEAAVRLVRGLVAEDRTDRSMEHGGTVTTVPQASRKP